jgi:hypothetical protein
LVGIVVCIFQISKNTKKYTDKKITLAQKYKADSNTKCNELQTIKDLKFKDFFQRRPQ